MLHAVVLGAAAGGGFPQWNSNAPGCRRARSGDPRAPARTQASLAVSVNECDWFLLNASPDLRSQIEATAVLHPRQGLRSSPIAGVVLSNADVDAIAGLLHLRERHRFAVYGPRRVLEVIAANSDLWRACARLRKSRRIAARQADQPRRSRRRFGLGRYALSRCRVRCRSTSKTAGRDPGTSEAGDTVGLEIIDQAAGGRLFFIPGCAAMTDGLRRRLEGAAVVFFDGTLWCDDEMIRAGIGEKTGRRMGHISMSGSGGAIAAFRDLGVRRRVFIHINNSNPVLLEDSAERREAEAAGWEIAFDGMELRL